MASSFNLTANEYKREKHSLYYGWHTHSHDFWIFPVLMILFSSFHFIDMAGLDIGATGISAGTTSMAIGIIPRHQPGQRLKY